MIDVIRSRRLGFVTLTLLISLLLISVSGSAIAKQDTATGVQNHLWLEAIGGTYIGVDPDPWLTESSTTSASNFDLRITYHDPSSNNDNDESVGILYLLVATNRPLTGGESIMVEGTELTGWTLLTDQQTQPTVTSDPEYKVSPHGVFQEGKGVYYKIIEVLDGDILIPGGNITLPVSINTLSPIKVHFDAVGANEENVPIVTNPFSHDCTATPPGNDLPPNEEIPEFPTIAIPAAMILGLVFLMQRKRN